MAGSGRLGELLLREQLITPLELQQAIEQQRNSGGRLGYQLTKMGFIEENELTAFLSKQYGVPSIDLGEFDIELDIIKLIPKEVVLKHQIIPVNRTGATLIVAMADPSNIFAIDDIKFLTGYNVEVVVASEQAIEGAVEKYYTSNVTFDDVMLDFDDEEVDVIDADEDINELDLEKSAGDAPVIKLVNLILLDAIRKGASDIHVEPFEKQLRVRYRIDGMLYEVMKPPVKLKHAITSRLKIMSQLDIAERRLPQDGRIKLKMGKNKEMDFRVSVLPTIWGEKVVLRLLDKSNLQLDMTKLGFEEKVLESFKKAVHMPYGMILITGPTGSGKTTTLYSSLSELNRSDVNISTAEDPVEYNLFGINQVQMHDDIGLNFSSSLRSFLRQDPDIILVGEIRDFETAEIAIKAALTGHMVLSTLHTNDAPSSVSRLLNMGIEPFLIAASVVCIGAQRLVRKNCSECREEIEVPTQSLLDLGFHPDVVDDVVVMRGSGCRICNGSGYKGRIAIYEILFMTDELREFILNGASTLELKREAIREGMKTLRMSALSKLEEGMTSLDEVVRMTAED
ncbi:MAG: type IV-A pilus assembly ATPase PilB [Rickettsiales bacterium]|nr:type IV-A pilus assembly ATPase PilB [Rickettsiales bacterium]|tara:strand:+ start:2153 stop:3853 length:1701 start_codon:yes stop_codon:yes gene_type:complete